MALLFGSTWNVNAVVFVSILSAIFITNQMVLKGWIPRPEISYGILFFVLALGYVFPFDRLLSLQFVPRLLASAVVIGLPIAFASFIFSGSFRQEKNLSNVFGSNLLGVVFGGALEYTSNISGLNSLYLLALALYLLSFLPKIGAIFGVGR
jgi:hypothetical protein